MKIVVTVGDVLDAQADALVSTANPWLNMSGGVNGAIRQRDPSIQVELHEHLKSTRRSAVPAGTVLRTSAGSLRFKHIIHVVAIDPFYDSSHQIVVDSLRAAFKLAASVGARSIAMPTLATGYGPLTVGAFALALKESEAAGFDLESVTVVVRSLDNAATIRSVLKRAL